MGQNETATRTNNTDRRIRKTRAALKNSLISLLREKNIKDISVKELTDLADVNRGTFYLHYKDVFDLLEQTEQDLFDEFTQRLDKIDPETLRDDPSQPFRAIYSICRENADFACILLSENGDIKFLRTMNKFFKERILKDFGHILKDKNIDDFEPFSYFLVGGCTNLVQYWFAHGLEQTPDELADLTVKLLMRNIV